MVLLKLKGTFFEAFDLLELACRNLFNNFRLKGTKEMDFKSFLVGYTIIAT